MNCNYSHDGKTPPDICPVCAATSDRFEADTSAKSKAGQGSKQKVIIAGASIAGVSAAEALREYNPDAEIILLSKESDLPYYRLNLTRYLAGEVKADELNLHAETWYKEKNINLVLDSELSQINPENKEVELRGDRKENYDKLILTMGSHPFIPPFPGISKENAMSLRTKADAEKIMEISKNPVRCVCIGGGILGLETAGALVKQGVDVTILEGFGWLLPRQLNQKAGEILESHVQSTGIKLQKNAKTKELAGDDRIREVILDDGSSLPADLVIITTGVRPNSYVARMAGLDVNMGIIVNDKLQTSNPDIFAAGDVSEHRGVLYGIWGPSQYQGTIAGMNAGGENVEFAGIPRSNMLKVLGYDMFSIGQILTEDASYLTFDGEIDNGYYNFIFRDNHMVGSILLGNTKLSAIVKNVVEKKIDCSQILKKSPQINDIIKYLEQI